MNPIPQNNSSLATFTVPDDSGVSPEGINRIGYDGSKSILTFPDGSVVVGDDEDEGGFYPDKINRLGHGENIADGLSEQELNDIGYSLKTLVEDDVESQSQFFESVATSIEYLGLTLSDESDEEGLPFKGASSVYSSAMHEVILDGLASLRSEIYKSSGMVDTVVMGESSDEAQDYATVKKEFFNYYFDVLAKPFRKEAIRAHYWSRLAGFIYKKVYECPIFGMPVSIMIPLQDFIVNREHSSHLTASRKTHVLRLSEREYDMRVMMGMYRDVDIVKSDDMLEDNDVIRQKLDNIRGRESQTQNYEDAGYVIYEIHVDYHIKSDPFSGNKSMPLPYVISIDAKSGKVVSIYRNWEEDDPLKKRKEYFVCYPYLPSLDGEGYGLVNYAGRLAQAATSMTRQLINSGTYANFPGGVYQAGLRLEGNNLRPAPAEFAPLQTGGQSIRDCIMALPYKEPSSALQELKNQVEESIRKPSAIISQKQTEVTARAPTGSVLAMFENLHKIPNAALQVAYEALTEELELLNDRFREYFKRAREFRFSVSGASYVITRDHFERDIRVVPSADPTARNSSHRLMQSEIVFDKAMQNPTIHNVEFVYRMLYKNIGLAKEDIDQLLSPKKDVQPPQPMDLVSTMMALMQGQPVAAAPWQDHDAYLSAIGAWMQQNPQNPHMAAAQALKEQHEAFKYMIETYAQLGMSPPEDPSQLTPDQQNQLAVEIAHIKVEQAQQAAAAATPPEPPLDPARVALEEVNAQREIAQSKHEVEYRRLELESKKIDMDYELKEKEVAIKLQVEALKQKIAQQKAEIDAFKVEHEQALKERDQALKERDSLVEEGSKIMNGLNNEEIA